MIEESEVEASGIEVRGAVEADVGRLVEFNRRMALETEGKELDAATLRAGVAAVFCESVAGEARKGRYLVATIDGRLVGALMHTWEWSDWRNGYVWWLQSVYVEPEFRRRGVFGRLYETLRGEALEEGGVGGVGGVVGLRLYVEEHNRIAQETYRGLGMESGGYVVMEDMLGGPADSSGA